MQDILDKLIHILLNILDWSAGQYTQLILGILLATAFSLFALFRSPRITVTFLLLIMPFQPMDTRFGTLNIFLVLLVGAAWLVRGKIKWVPLLPSVFLIMAANLASLSQQPTSEWTQHLPYLISLTSCFLFFYIVYNYVRESASIHKIVMVLAILNVLVIIYCTIQMLYGTEKTALFGIKELTMLHARGGSEPRLLGPFAAAGITAEYLVLSMMVIAYELLHTPIAKTRLFLYLLMAANVGLLVATGNRGGFLSLLGGGLLFLYAFRRELGFARSVKLVASVGALAVIATVIILNFTRYNVLFDRLAETEMVDGVPDTREGNWGPAIAMISERPILGHGPRPIFVGDTDADKPGLIAIFYPHDLYLFLLYTVGAVGFLSYMLFFGTVFLRLRRAGKSVINDTYLNQFPILGQILIVVFFVDQIKVEFLRIALTDYWQFVFALMAILLAVADMVINRAEEERKLEEQTEAEILPYTR